MSSGASRQALRFWLTCWPVQGDFLRRTWAESNLDELGEGVWWAGVQAAPVWLDVARDYGEDWTHHQQIRDAVKATGTLLGSFLDPVLDTFMRALPRTSEALEGDADAL